MSNPTSVGAAAPPRHPRRSWMAIGLPLLVIVATAGLIFWTAWPTLRPVKQVHVTQAVFDRNAPTAVHPVAQQSSDRDAKAGFDRHRGGRTSGQIVQAPGWLEAEPFYVAATALADGVIQSVDVLEGDRVEKGQVVAKLVAEDSQLRLRQAEAAIATANSELASAKARLTEARQNWDEPVALEKAVETGEAMVAEARAELEQLPALIQEAQAERERFDEQRDRIKQSYDAQAASETELIIARQQAASALARVKSLEAREPLLKAKLTRFEAELRAARRDLELRIADRRALDEAKANLKQAEARVERAQADRDVAALELERMTIRSPIDGVVQQRIKVPGDKVMLGADDRMSAHIVHLYDPERLQVRVDVPLADASNIFAGQACEVVVEILPDQTFRGEVLRITHLADLQKNTLEVKVKVIDPSPLLRPDMLTRVKFLPRRAEPASGKTTQGQGPVGNSAASSATRPSGATVLVPGDVVVGQGDAKRVWTVADRRADRGVARPVTIQTVSQQDGWLRVRGDLQPGTLLIINPQNLKDGQPVKFSSAPESAPESTPELAPGLAPETNSMSTARTRPAPVKGVAS